MTEATSTQSDPETGPVLTQPKSATGAPPAAPQVVYVPQPPGRVSRVAAWVGIAAGSVFIVAVIFGAGVFVGKSIGGGEDSRHHFRGPLMVSPGVGGFPTGPPVAFDRGPAFAGPFGPGGPIIDIPRAPGQPASPTSKGAPTPP